MTKWFDKLLDYGPYILLYPYYVLVLGLLNPPNDLKEGFPQSVIIPLVIYIATGNTCRIIILKKGFPDVILFFCKQKQTHSNYQDHKGSRWTK